jgi:hypothetical protein
MNGSITLSVYEIVGSPLCVASDDGQKVYERLATALKEGRDVAVSFLNVASLTSAFLNAAIGQLYGAFTEDQIRAKVRVQDMAGDDLALLKRVVDTSKEYFRDISTFEAAAQEMLGGDDE